MVVVKPRVEFVGTVPSEDSLLKELELCARVCYKSEDKITQDSAKKLLTGLLNKKKPHWSVFEMMDIKIRFIISRHISHEFVRHRIASFLQESTRYVDYKKKGEVEFIEPLWITELIRTASVENVNDIIVDIWAKNLRASEETYFTLRERGIKPEDARGSLTHDLKTELIYKANLRQWFHTFDMRCDKAAHPDMVYVMSLARDLMRAQYPTLFGGLHG